MKKEINKLERKDLSRIMSDLDQYRWDFQTSKQFNLAYAIISETYLKSLGMSTKNAKIVIQQSLEKLAK